jgi:hypothetical protein
MERSYMQEYVEYGASDGEEVGGGQAGRSSRNGDEVRPAPSRPPPSRSTEVIDLDDED